MKKKVKKLTLSTETLRRLGDHSLEKIAGGVTAGTAPCTECTFACSLCRTC
jgi:hypothetical protein